MSISRIVFFFLTHLLSHTVREGAFSVRWREPGGPRLRKSQAATRGSSSTWTWAESWLAPAPSGERTYTLLAECRWGAFASTLYIYLSCAARHLNELSGYYLHHLPNLSIKKKEVNQADHQIAKQEMSSLSWDRNHLSGVCAGMDTQQSAVLVTVMVGGGVVHPMMPIEQQQPHPQNNIKKAFFFLDQLILCGELIPVEHIKIQAGEHAFPWSTSRKGSTSTHHHVQDCKRDKILLLQRERNM